MRHFTLMKLLTVSSFAASPDKKTPSSSSSSARTTPSRPPPTAQIATVVPEPAVTANNNNDNNDNNDNVDNGRRTALYSVLFTTTTAAFVVPPKKSAQALDMDAFVNSQLAADTKNCDPKKDAKCKPSLNQDEALCQYGQNGSTARAEACQRVKAAGGTLPTPGSQGKSLGGAYAM